MAPLVAAGLVRRFAFDTYEREIERYGGPGAIALAERWFWADSEAVVDIIEAVGTGDGGADVRWRAAVAGVDRLLDDFGLDLEARSVSMRTLREGFGREFRADASLRRQLARKFRGFHDELSGLLLEGVPAGQPIGDAVAAVALRSERSRADMAGLRRMDQERLLQQTIPVLAESCVHMHLNRLFRCDNRLHEFVICDLLAELYGRRANRLKRPVNPPPPR
jgi:thiopeptide-type bacteriocin biosynthesis protein